MHTRSWLENTYIAACRLELAALKPGNVGLHRPGHRMVAADFLHSAQMTAKPLTESRYNLGERIYQAIATTRAKVQQNTNLGIVLLCAPLLLAAQTKKPTQSLWQRLHSLLQGADENDSRRIGEAILLAQPGGLGDSPQHDLRQPLQASLAVVMKHAAARDQIAQQYSRNYHELFTQALPFFRRCKKRFTHPRWAVTAFYLRLLARVPDSHTQRRQGAATAATVSAWANTAWQLLNRCQHIEQMRRSLLLLDATWKQTGINPGTTADLTVATLLLDRLLPNPVALARLASTPPHGAEHRLQPAWVLS